MSIPVGTHSVFTPPSPAFHFGEVKVVVGSKIKAILPSIWRKTRQKEREGIMENEPREKQSQKGMVVSGLIILGMGVLFLANEMGWIPGLHRTWPLILIVVGLALILGAVFKKPSGTPGQ